MGGTNHDPFGQSFGGPPKQSPAQQPTPPSAGWGAPAQGSSTPATAAPAFTMPTAESAAFPAGHPLAQQQASEAPAPTLSKKQAKAAAKEQAAQEKRDAKSARSAKKDRAPSKTSVKAAAVEQKQRTPIGQRYGGDRRRWMLLVVGVILVPLLAIAALVVASGKASKADIDAAVAKALDSKGSNFPDGQAVMWAGQVVRTWGTWDEKDQTGQRDVLIAQFLSSGMDPAAGWNGKGKQEVIYSTVNPNPTVVDKNHAIVDAAYQVQDGTWRCVALPTYAYHPKGFSADAPYAFALAANPVPVACAPRTGAPTVNQAAPSSEGNQTQNDQEAATNLTQTYLPGFLAAWAASDQATMKQYAVDGAQLVGLGGEFESTPAPEVGEVTVPVPSGGKVQSGETYNVTVPVTWTVAGSTSQVQASYSIKLKRVGGQWFVTGEPAPVVQDSTISGGQTANIPAPKTGDKADLFSNPNVSTPTSKATTTPSSK